LANIVGSPIRHGHSRHLNTIGDHFQHYAHLSILPTPQSRSTIPPTVPRPDRRLSTTDLDPPPPAVHQPHDTHKNSPNSAWKTPSAMNFLFLEI
jgi:hypothetical protein